MTDDAFSQNAGGLQKIVVFKKCVNSAKLLLILYTNYVVSFALVSNSFEHLHILSNWNWGLVGPAKLPLADKKSLQKINLVSLNKVRFT